MKNQANEIISENLCFSILHFHLLYKVKLMFLRMVLTMSLISLYALNHLMKW